MQKDYHEFEMQSEAQLDRQHPKKKTLRDTLSSIACLIGAIALLIGLIVLTRYRTLFPTTMRPFDLNDTSLNHPEKPYTVTGAANVIVSSITVLLVTLNYFFCEGKLAKRNVLKILLTVYFTILGACFMILFVNWTKNLAGRFRPYFLTACKPNPAMVEELRAKGTSWVDEEMSKTICTSERSLKYRWSFPSGHSAEAWYAMALSILILHYTQNIGNKFTENRSLILPFKAVFQFIFFAFGSWIGITRTLDYHHFWWDVLAGSLIGVLISVVMFFWFVKPVMESAEKSRDSAVKKCAHLTGLQKSGFCCVKGEEMQEASSNSQEEVPLGTLGGEE